MPTGFGIVGCGMIANFHAKAIADLRGAKLVGGFDAIPASADRFAEAQDCTAFHDIDEMLADDSIDVVTICTPSGAHMEPAVAAAKAGKHVIIEKPLEVTLKRCDKIIAACEEAGVICSTIFPSRFHDAAQEIKSAIDSGRFGALSMADAYVKWWREQKYYDSGAWRGTWKLDGGGALMNQAIHSVDLLAWFMGDVSEISAYASTIAHERIAVEDVAVAILKFANGALGSIEATTASYPGSLKRIEIRGSGGTAIMEEENILEWEFAKGDRKDKKVLEKLGAATETGGGASDPAAIGHHGHTRQFKDVLEAIKKGTPPRIDGPEGRRSVEIILAVYKAAESGKPVTLPLKSDPVLKARKLDAEVGK